MAKLLPELMSVNIEALPDGELLPITLRELARVACYTDDPKLGDKLWLVVDGLVGLIVGEIILAMVRPGPNSEATQTGARVERALMSLENGIKKQRKIWKKSATKMARHGKVWDMYKLMSMDGLTRGEALERLGKTENSIKQYVAGTKARLLSLDIPEPMRAAMTVKSKPKKRKSQFARSTDVRRKRR
jgi:hypothetical protein